MAAKKKGTSKNAGRKGADKLISKWGGEIKMKSVFKDGRMHQVAYCTQTGNEGRRPSDLME